MYPPRAEVKAASEPEVSISRAEDESRGTARIYVAPYVPCGEYPEPLLLTVAHVSEPRLPENLRVPFPDDIENISGSVTAPGELDNLENLYSAKSSNSSGQDQYLQHVLTYGNVVGEGRIGVSKSNFRKNWAVVNVEREGGGQNGVWWDVRELKLLARFHH